MAATLLLNRKNLYLVSGRELLRAAALALAGGFLVWLSLILTHTTGDVVTIWPVNGFMLAMLIALPRREWLAYVPLAYGANVAGALIYGDVLELCLPLCLCNVAEALMAASLLTRNEPRFDLSQLRTLYRFISFGMVVPPLLFGICATIIVSIVKNASPFGLFHTWFLADAFGIGIVTPVMLNLLRGEWRNLFANSIGRSLLSMLVFAVAAALVFNQTRYPLLFVIPPFLLLVMAQTGMAGIAFAVPLLAGIALEGTLRGTGPFAINPNLSHQERIILLQVFTLCCLVLGSWGTLLLEERRRTLTLLQEERSRLIDSERKLGDSEALHRLMSENSRDIIICSNLQGVRRYVSPAVEEILGWRPDEFIGHHWREFAHPDEHTLLEGLIDRLRNGPGMETATYRYRCKNGAYCWVEGHMRLIRDAMTGEPLEFVGNIRDITRRKEAEDKLAEAYAEMELTAATDGLTGIANRRHFDVHLEEVWRRAQRDGTPLALLLIDADQFKAYNDYYGHLKGDDILRFIGECMANCVNRLDDLAARYGGEEFAMILPTTPRDGAVRIAENLRTMIEKTAYPHKAGVGGIVTVSIGIAIMHPTRDQHPSLLVSAADTALYKAKSEGRNRVSVF